jgi:hypothetical protein
MLTKLQAGNLAVRNSLDPTTRAKNDYAVIKKVESYLDDIEDLDKILSYLPKDKVQKYLKDRHVSTLLRASIALMRQLDYRIVWHEANGLYVMDDALGKTQPTGIDIKRTKLLIEHSIKLEEFYDPTVEIPGYRKPLPSAQMKRAVIRQQKKKSEKSPNRPARLP